MLAGRRAIFRSSKSGQLGIVGVNGRKCETEALRTDFAVPSQAVPGRGLEIGRDAEKDVTPRVGTIW